MNILPDGSIQQIIVRFIIAFFLFIQSIEHSFELNSVSLCYYKTVDFVGEGDESGFIMAAFDQRKQALHDRLAKTLVINRR